MDLVALDPEALRRLALRRRRTWIAVIGGNALMVLLLVGGPWYRGRSRAMESRQAFGSLVACLWNGETGSRGLTLPDGDLAHYADAARDEDWPGRCAPLLDEIVEEPVFFIFPDARQAEDDVRRAVVVVRRELNAARERSETVPSRPRLAVLRLSAALAILSEEADAYRGLDAPAVTFGADPQSVLPERVPVQVETNAELEVRARADGVELLSKGGRAISWVRVGGGRVDLRRYRRPSLLGGWVRERTTPWLVWWTPESRCADEPCFRRATGVAALTDDVVVTPEPTWLGAHPANGAASVAIEDGQAWVAARTETGVELRRFDLEAAPENRETEESDEAETRPLVADGSWILEGATHAVVDAGRVWFLAEGMLFSQRGDERTLVAEVAGGELSREGPWMAAWGEGLTLLHESQESRESRVLPFPDLDGPLDALRIAGDEAHAVLAVETADGLHTLWCSPTECAQWQRVTDRPRAWDVVFEGEGAVIAWSETERGPIQVRDVGVELGPVVMPAACFDTDPLTGEPTGMCGRPVLGARAGRVFLVAREGDDAWVIEREGGRWRPLRGLR